MIELITVYFNGKVVYRLLAEFLSVLRSIPSSCLTYFTWDRQPTKLTEIHSDATLNELTCRINALIKYVIKEYPCDSKATRQFISGYNIPERRKYLK